jgi:hypothetical protein
MSASSARAVTFAECLHCWVTNGAFTPDGTFHAMEILSPSVIMEIFQHKVFKMLLKRGLITLTHHKRNSG